MPEKDQLFEAVAAPDTRVTWHREDGRKLAGRVVGRSPDSTAEVLVRSDGGPTYTIHWVLLTVETPRVV